MEHPGDEAMQDRHDPEHEEPFHADDITDPAEVPEDEVDSPDQTQGELS